MSKIRITFEIKSEQRKQRRISRFEKLINAFIQLASQLRSDAKAKLLRLIVVLIAVTYLLCRIIPMILNHL